MRSAARSATRNRGTSLHDLFLATYLPKATLTIGADKVRLATAGTALFVTDLNTKLASSDSATYAVNTIGYAGNAAMFGDKAGGKLNFSNAGTLSNNSIATGLGFMRINGTSSGLTASTYTPYAIGGNAVNVYFDTANTLHISAISAVPEPETYAMLLAGLGLMGAIARWISRPALPFARQHAH